MKKKLLLSLLLSFPLSTLFAQTTYYLQDPGGGASPIDMNDILNWEDGSSNNPSDFSTATDIWDMNGVNGRLSDTLVIAGQLQNGGTADTIDLQGWPLTLEGVVAGANLYITDKFPLPVLRRSTVSYTSNSSTLKHILPGTYRNLEIAGSNNFNAVGDITVEDTLRFNTSSSSRLVMGSYQLAGSSSFEVSNIGSGGFTIETASTFPAPIPEDIYWPNGTRVVFTSGSTQYVTSGSYDSLYFSGAGQKIISVDDTVEVRNNFDSYSEVLIEASSSGYGQLHSHVDFNDHGSGTITKQFYLDVSTPRYYHIGIPLSTGNLQDLNDGQTMNFANDNTGSVWAWDAATSEWIVPSTTGNNATIGYAVFAGNSSGTDFITSTSQAVEVSASNLHYQNISRTLQYDDGTSSTATFSDAIIDGWNFIANPFLTNYDFEGHNINPGAGGTGTMSDYYYVFNGSNYVFYQKGGLTNGTGGSSSTQGADRHIAPGQGFWVRVSSTWSGATTFQTADMKMSGTASMFKTTAPADILKLQVTEKTSGLADQVIIRFHANATDGEDFNLDVPKKSNPGNVPNTYVKLGNGTYALCAADFSRTSFPLHFADVDDKQLMEFNIVQNSITMYNKVFIEDKKNNSFTELTTGNYSFANDTAFGADRFVIHFQNTVGLPEGMVESANYDVYYGNDALNFVFQSNDFKPTSGSLYSLQGKLIYSFEIEEPNASVQLPSVAAGIYLISIEGDVSGARKVYIK